MATAMRWMPIAGLVPLVVSALCVAGSQIEIRTYGAPAPLGYGAEVREIVGLETAAAEHGGGLVATVTELDRAVKDLGAEVRTEQIQVDLSADVLFDFDRWNIKPAAEAALQKLVLIIREKRKGDVLITGHTDAKGSEDYNQRLSERRAEAVMYWLAVNGDVPMDVIKTRGRGESEPVAPNTHPDGSDDPAGRAKNRRVQILIGTVAQVP